MGVLRSSTSCDIDFDKKDRQVSFVRLAYSDNRHAYSTIPVPIAVIANGEGPTVFLAAGTHGDEYEGQVILRRMIHRLDPASVRGRFIIMPALNYPAVLASARISPLDDGNLAPVFPSEEGASPTLEIAHFVDSKILPLCDALTDLHSGGRAADMIPQTHLCRGSDAALNARRLELLAVFAAPLTVVASEEASPGYLTFRRPSVLVLLHSPPNSAEASIWKALRSAPKVLIAFCVTSASSPAIPRTWVFETRAS